MKAAKVGAYLAGQVGPEMSRMMERIEAEISNDPLSAIFRGLKGISGPS